MSKLEKVKIVSKNGHPKAELYFTADFKGYYCYPSWKRLIKREVKNGNSVFTMPIRFFEEFLRINKEICGDTDNIVYDKDSIKEFYGYTTSSTEFYSTQLTENYIKKWVGYDCPNLIKYSVNIDRHKNWAGFNFLMYENVLYSSSVYDTSVDELTDTEFKAFEKAMDKDWYCFQKIKEAYENQNAIVDVKAIENEVAKYEQEVQRLINTYQSELTEFGKKLPERMLDCGFSMIYTSDDDINKKISLLKTKGVRNVDYLNVKFPEDYFSVCNSELIFKKFKELANCQIANQLSIRTVLD